MNTQSNHNTARWLITGGAGFIGTNLIEKLMSEGARYIRILDNLSVGTREDLADVCTFTEVTLSDLSLSPSELSPESSTLSPDSLSQSSVLSPQTLNNHMTSVELIVGDILDYELVIRATQGIDIIVHLAASTGVPNSVENPRSDMEANVIGTFNMLEASRHNSVKKFIFASSGAPIGEVEPPIHEELAPHPVSPYGASKLAGEAYCSAYYKTFALNTVSLRFGNVYGPGSRHKSSVIAKFIRQAMKGETLEVYGDGNQTRDFIYIDDLIRAIRLSASVAGVGGETFQIATSTETTIRQLLEKLMPILTVSGINDVKVRHSETRQGDVRRNFSDTSKARKILGWIAETELTEGLTHTLKWFLRRVI